MKKIVLFVLLVLGPAGTTSAEQLSMTTYYPAPYCRYLSCVMDLIQLTPAALPASCDPGTLAVNTSNQLQICNAAPPNTWSSISGVWSQDKTTGAGAHNYIFPVDYADATQRVGIGTNNPDFKLHLVNDGGIIAQGTVGSGRTLSVTGNGARFIWYPRKAALRAGNVLLNTWDDINIGTYSIAFGFNNRASGASSAILGGSTNTATLDHALVVAGLTNNATGTWATVVNGLLNDATSTYSTVVSGQSNKNHGSTSIIGSGSSNTNYALQSFIGSGLSNDISLTGANSVIVGGQDNDVTSLAAGVVGGRDNNTAGNYSFIGGGADNTITAAAAHSVVAGGRTNTASGQYSVVSGGGGASALEGNEAIGNYSIVSGGHRNTAGGVESSIHGGLVNTIAAAGLQSHIVGGSNNTINSQYSMVVGGTGHVVNEDWSYIIGGSTTNLSGEGGNYLFGSTAVNLTNGAKDNVLFNTTLTGVNGGSYNFIFDPSNIAGNTVTGSGHFLIYPSNQVPGPIDPRVGIGLFNPTAKLHVNGDVKIETVPAGSGTHYLKWNSGTKQLTANDVAELFPASEEVEVGDLLVIDENQDVMLKKSSVPYDTKAAGIVSALPAILFEGSTLHMAPGEMYTKGTKPPVALAGRVLLKVSLENGPITRGDLLTSSSTPGHAMKATDPARSFGAVVGKALEPFEGGPDGEKTGMIMVLVTLQ